ncbi:hypothetical protein G6M89_02040 [Natronolimnobius sp. AArcel1]|uniref:hypothetical protein n=1 Tax=Natronolimnobius sp. AArcel1 TaxID=1679093 RepID=UPI0013EC4B50|nr:hypothetical protein [Natronolimnobius sp. AArcel1]NGM67800.1 hypothetical protein [Natronolimnobius sp. AArcel1]
MNMIQLSSIFGRLRRVYAEEGLRSLVGKSISYVYRSTLHKAGLIGLYGSDQFLELLQWKNAGFGHYNAEPFEIVEVDPSEIEFVTGRGPFPGRFRWIDIGTVSGGDWDRSTERVDDLPVVRELMQRFDQENAWSEVSPPASDADGESMTFAAEIDREAVDRLYASIAADGYKRKRGLLKQNGHESTAAHPRFEPYDEVVVDIGRDGELLFVDGRHRLAIARCLNIDRIPVRIAARHREWVEANATDE